MARLLAIAGVLVVVTACGSGSSAGKPCTVRTDCDPGESCFTDSPGGFCSKGCAQEGETTDCPNGTVCTYVGGTDLVCSPTCTTAGDCREQYTCGSVINTTTKACKPGGV